MPFPMNRLRWEREKAYLWKLILKRSVDQTVGQYCSLLDLRCTFLFSVGSVYIHNTKGMMTSDFTVESDFKAKRIAVL